MTNVQREELKVGSQRAVLAGVLSPEATVPREDALDELRGLVETAGAEVVGEMTQVRDKIHSGTVFGSGKVEQLRQLANSRGANLVIFDNNLTPSQGRNLEKELQKQVVDRSEVILDIFATHARSYEAKLQVELAQLLYYRTRLKRMWTHLERIQGGIGTGRGPGEKQIETDRRLIDRRISELRRKIESVERRRERTVDSRSKQPTVSLVGYTNAGKSTLMNALTGADVYVADQLFATLDTRTRRWEVDNFGAILLSDTVGFVRNLPHHLVASFRSTLEEARQSDLLMHVVDASNPEAEEHIAAVEQVLKDIDVDTGELILVLNKIDRDAAQFKRQSLLAKYPDAVEVSAVTGQGLAILRERVIERLSGGFAEVAITLDSHDGKTLHFLREHADIWETSHSEDGRRATVECSIAELHLKQIAWKERIDVERLAPLTDEERQTASRLAEEAGDRSANDAADRAV